MCMYVCVCVCNVFFCCFFCMTLTVVVLSCTMQWNLSVWKGDAWEENLSFLYAVVVIGSVIISALLFAVLVAW